MCLYQQHLEGAAQTPGNQVPYELDLTHSDRQTEVVNKELEDYLCCFTSLLPNPFNVVHSSEPPAILSMERQVISQQFGYASSRTKPDPLPTQGASMKPFKGKERKGGGGVTFTLMWAVWCFSTCAPTR